MRTPTKPKRCVIRGTLYPIASEIPEAPDGGFRGGPSGGPKTPKKPEKTSKNGVFGGSKIGVKKPEKNTFFGHF